MQDPAQLYSMHQTEQELGHPVLIVGMTGFVDAGAAVRLSVDALLGQLPNQPMVTFAVDELLDYRSRRPIMVFAADHWEAYSEPVLAMHLVRDGAGVPFLLLTGPEPDLQWERFTRAVVGLVERLGVRMTVGLNAIPMAVPHTRPTGMSAHATRAALVAGYEPWVGTVQVPGSAAALLELRLGQAGHDAVGFAVHVPHYLAQMEFPTATIALLQAVASCTGLALPVEALREAAEQTQASVAAQVSQSEEVAGVVKALEEQYDAYAGSRTRANLIAEPGAQLPTADELGAAFERFLAEQGEDEG